MALRIKLRRQGSKKEPMYKIVVLERTTGIRSKPISTLGFINFSQGSLSNSVYVVVNFDLLGYWLTQGATMSRRLKRLLRG